jgi:subtilisin family serine protease
VLSIGGRLAWCQTEKVGADVYARLAAAGRVRVLIFLASPSALRNGGPLKAMQTVSLAQDAILSDLSSRDFRLKRRYQTIPALAGEVSEAGLQRLVALPGVLRVDLDEGGTGSLAEVLPLIHADEVQALGFRGQGVTVAILDSGVDTDHPDLGDDLDGQVCFCSTLSGEGGCCPNGLAFQTGAGAAEDDHGHGSNVAGIVTSNGIVSHVGVAPKAKIVAIKVIDRNNRFCCSSDVVAGLDWILSNRPDVDIVNMSLGTSALFSGDCDRATAFTRAFASAINALRNKGVTTFASAGNNASGAQMTAPACVANTVSVGAVWDSNVGAVTVLGCRDSTTAADRVTCFSNSDSSTDLFAPGAPTTSDWLFGGISTFFGTSQASPASAACAADLLQAHPGLTPSQIETTLKATGVAVTDAKNGLVFPRVDCRAALDSLTCADADGDGYGSPAVFTCPGGGQADCDDADPRIHPGAIEVCDGIDNDCNGIMDDESAALASCDDDDPCTVDACRNGACSYTPATIVQLTCSATPGPLNVKSQGRALGFRLVLRDRCSGGALDGSLLGPVYVSGLVLPGGNEMNLPIPNHSAGCTQDGIWETPSLRTVIPGGVVEIRFLRPSDGDCRTLDGNRQDILALLQESGDHQRAQIILASDYSGAPAPVRCRASVTLIDGGAASSPDRRRAAVPSRASGAARRDRR